MKHNKKILLLNVGSSTIKWLFLSKKSFFGKEEDLSKLADYGKALEKIFQQIENPDVIVHRIVHGGEISKPKVLDNNLISRLDKISKLAPLHNIPELNVVKACKKFSCRQIAVFDTSFYSDMPVIAKMYGLPYSLFEKGIKRYGFHGLSHEYIAKQIEKKLGKNKKLVSCHLGAGCSITAIKGRKAMDTSMGFTPLEGVIMATRSGNIDPSIVIYLEKEKKMSINQINELLNKKSGFFGISGILGMKDLLKDNSKRAKLAVELFCYSIAKQIAAYASVLNGIDVVAFTGGIGENEARIRDIIIKQLSFLGKIKVEVIKTNEFEIMLDKAERLIKKTNGF